MTFRTESIYIILLLSYHWFLWEKEILSLWRQYLNLIVLEIRLLNLLLSFSLLIWIVVGWKFVFEFLVFFLDNVLILFVNLSFVLDLFLFYGLLSPFKLLFFYLNNKSSGITRLLQAHISCIIIKSTPIKLVRLLDEIFLRRSCEGLDFLLANCFSRISL